MERTDHQMEASQADTRNKERSSNINLFQARHRSWQSSAASIQLMASGELDPEAYNGRADGQRQDEAAAQLTLCELSPYEERPELLEDNNSGTAAHTKVIAAGGSRARDVQGSAISVK